MPMPNKRSIVRAPAEALDQYGNLRIGGGLPSHRRMMMASAAGKVTTPSSASEWEGSTGSYDFVGDDILNNTGDKAIRTVSTFSGDVEFNATVTDNGQNGGFGFYEADEDATFNENASPPGTDLMTDSWWWEVQGAISYGGVTKATEAFGSGQAVKLERVGGVFKYYEAGVLRHTFAETSTNPIRICLGDRGGGALDLDNVSWTA